MLYRSVAAVVISIPVVAFAAPPTPAGPASPGAAAAPSTRPAAFAPVANLGLVSTNTNDRAGNRILGRIIPELRLQHVTLADALDFLRDSTNANIHVNWRALEAAGVSRDATVSTNLANLPLRRALTFVLSDAVAGDVATFYADGGVIEVTTRELADRQMVTRVYPIDDLIMDVPDFVGPQFSIQNATQGQTGGGGGQSLFQGSNAGPGQSTVTPPLTKDQRAQQIVDMITQTIRPDIWRANGGPASITYFRGSLIVTAPRSVQDAIGGR